MVNLNSKLYNKILEAVNGVILIDMDGIIKYITKQCTEYLKVDYNGAVGSHVLEVFPDSKMVENLGITEPVKVFYHIHDKTGVSMNVPIYENGKKVGILEYDIFLSGEIMDEYYDKYNLFNNDTIDYYREEVKNLRGTKYSINNLVGTSPKMQKVRELIMHAARTSSTVLISGETGTGKEVVAHAIHNLSSRKNKDLIRINAATIPESIAESELFGYEGGTFTGASKEGKIGKFEIANKGTLFIDEINQLPISLQPKLLRVLQEKEIDRVGGTKSIPIDTRIIVASNKDLLEMTKAGDFRLDLYYRLNVVEIKMPNLRERKEDIPAIVDDLVNKLNHQMGRNIQKISDDIMKILVNREWPGNIRELQNAIERAINYADGEVLLEEHFSWKEEEKIDFGKYEVNPIEEAKKEVEKRLILESLKVTNYNKTEAAKLLKISRPLLYQKIERLDLEIPKNTED